MLLGHQGTLLYKETFARRRFCTRSHFYTDCHFCTDLNLLYFIFLYWFFFTPNPYPWLLSFFLIITFILRFFLNFHCYLWPLPSVGIYFIIILLFCVQKWLFVEKWPWLRKCLRAYLTRPLVTHILVSKIKELLITKLFWSSLIVVGTKSLLEVGGTSHSEE